MSSPAPYMKRYTLERHQGIPHRVPATRAAAHITALHDAGMTWTQIAAQTGRSPGAAAHLIRAARAGGNINLATQRTWLAVTYQPPTTRRAALKITPEVGTGRRIRALVALGWTYKALKRETGISDTHLSDIARQMPGRGTPGGVTAATIRTTYDRLSMTRPEGTRADTARRRARHLGWPPPLAWDDIDDPDETPTGHKPGRGRATNFHLDDITEHLTHNPATTTAQLAHRFGVQPNAIQQRLVRAGRTDLLDQLARNATLAGHSNGRRKGQAA